jgi:hypothetical protein
MRKAVEALKDQPATRPRRLHARRPQAIRIVPSTGFEGDLYGLMSAYIAQRRASRAATTRRARPRPIRWRTPATACATCCRTWTAGRRCRASRRRRWEEAPGPAGLLPGLDPLGQPGAGEGRRAGGPPARGLRRRSICARIAPRCDSPLVRAASPTGGGGLIRSDPAPGRGPAVRRRRAAEPGGPGQAPAGGGRRRGASADCTRAMPAGGRAGQVAGRWRFQTAPTWPS